MKPWQVVILRARRLAIKSQLVNGKIMLLIKERSTKFAMRKEKLALKTQKSVVSKNIKMGTWTGHDL